MKSLGIVFMALIAGVGMSIFTSVLGFSRDTGFLAGLITYWASYFLWRAEFKESK